MITIQIMLIIANCEISFNKYSFSQCYWQTCKHYDRTRLL